MLPNKSQLENLDFAELLVEISEMNLVKKKPNSPFYYTNFRYKGRYITRSTRCTTKPDARAFAAKLKTELILKDKIPAVFGKHTFKKARLRYLKSHTIDYTIVWLGKELDTYLLADVNENVIYKLTQKLEARGNGPDTIKRKLAVLRSILNLCKKWKWLQIVPDFDMPACPNNERHRNTTDNEIQKVFAVLPDYLKAPILFYVSTGFRKSEVVNLKWEQLSKDKSTITLTKQKNNKTSLVPLTALEKKIVGDQEDKHPIYVFPGHASTKHGNLGDFKKAWTTARKKVGLYKKGSKNNLTIHDLRHLLGNNLARNNASDNLISSVLRHSSITLARRYRNQNADLEVIGKENVSKTWATMWATNLSQGEG